jgi:uncharacterized protein YjbI with pentapeptide repeats
LTFCRFPKPNSPLLKHPGAILWEASLQGANFQEANLKHAVLEGAYLQRADLSRARGLELAQVIGTIGSNKTALPEALTRPTLWSEPIEEQEKFLRNMLGAD